MKKRVLKKKNTSLDLKVRNILSQFNKAYEKFDTLMWQLQMKINITRHRWAPTHTTLGLGGGLGPSLILAVTQ